MDCWSFTGKDKTRVPVQLPHTWNNLDGQDGGNDYYRGTCIYDCRVAKPAFAADEQVYLQFHGVNASAKVIFNGKTICERDGGYATFRMNVTELLQDENEIVVEVDNSVNDRVYPQKADFTFYGGIYRDVEFLIVNEAHFDLDYFGSPGIQYTTEIVRDHAKVKVRTYKNKAAEGCMTFLTLRDAEGNVVAMGEGDESVLTVANVHLWDGLNNPYLYELKAELVQEAKVLDEITCNVGVRSFRFDPKDGFHLNGRPYPLHGVSRHQDYKGLGNAISKAEHERDMALIREVGANTIRLAHYQHDQYFYDLCDKAGMIVWAEIPYISEHLANGNDNTTSQMTELIVQNYNHPSIVVWGISNEITISGRKYKKQMLENHRRLNDLVHKMDPTRLTTLACFAMCIHWNRVAHITDLVGWNLYLGWYVPFLWLNDLWIGVWHLLYPKRMLCYSEYGAEGMPNLHSARPRRGDNTEEYQRKYHEFMLECFKRHPYMWGHYYWNMFDFAADARDQGGEAGMNHKGMISFDRKVKKDVFYLYKAYWGSENFVHLTGKRYAYRTESVTDVTVYSTEGEVFLYCNGKLLETKKGDKVFKFKVPMQKEMLLEARAGKHTDKATIFKTDKPRPEYKMQKGDSSNWM